jgi:hypothetical protein
VRKLLAQPTTAWNRRRCLKLAQRGQHSSDKPVGDHGGLSACAPKVSSIRGRQVSDMRSEKADGRRSVPFGRDCCQYCCQATGQHRSQVDGCGLSAQRTDRNGRSWTTCLSLRIRGLQFGLQFTTVRHHPGKTSREGWSSLNRSGQPYPELLMR